MGRNLPFCVVVVVVDVVVILEKMTYCPLFVFHNEIEWGFLVFVVLILDKRINGQDFSSRILPTTKFGNMRKKFFCSIFFVLAPYFF